MRRIKQNGENESVENAWEAFDRFAKEKHKRWNIMRYEQDIDLHVHEVVCDIVNDTFSPSGYSEKWIFDKKPRKLLSMIIISKRLRCCLTRLLSMIISHGMRLL